MRSGNGKLSLVVVDSLSKWMEQLYLYWKKAAANWEIYNGFNADVRKMFNKYLISQVEVPVCLFALPELLEVDTDNPNISSRETHAKVYGKELRGTIEKEFAIVLGCEQDDEDNHFFRVHGTSTLPYKTPRGMFEEDTIPNDLQIVVERALEFLGEVPHMLVLGRSGTGKSSSMENLDPATTGIVNVENKSLPFPKASKFIHHKRLPLTLPPKRGDLWEEEIPGYVTRGFKDVMNEFIYGEKEEKSPSSLTPAPGGIKRLKLRR